MSGSNPKPYCVSFNDRVSRTLTNYSDSEVADVLECLETELAPVEMLGIHDDGTHQHIIQLMSSGHYAYYVEVPSPDAQPPGSSAPHYCVTFVLNAKCINAALVRMTIKSHAATG